MKNAFWKSTTILLRYKRLMAMAMAGALLSALCYGTGLAMVLPALTILMGGEDERAALAEQFNQPDHPEYVRQTGRWLENQIEADQQTPVKRMIETKLGRPDRPQLVRDLGDWLNAHIPDDSFEAFVLVMAVIAVISLLGILGQYLHEVFMLTIVFRAAMTWRSRLLRRVLHAPMIQHYQSGTAEHMTRITTDTMILASGYRIVLGKTVAEVLKGAAALLTAFLINWKLACIAAVGVPLIAVLLRKFGKRIRRAATRALRQRAIMLRLLKESLDNLNVVKVHNAEGFERRRFARANRGLYGEEMRVRRTRALASPLIEALSLVGVLIVACISAWLIFRGNQSPGDFITVLVILVAAGRSLKPLSNMNNQVAESGAAAERIFQMLDMPVEPLGEHVDEPAPMLPRHRRDIEFDQASFAFPTQQRPAVNDANLKVGFGQVVAVVGANGSGKTTMVSMLARLVEPSMGHVLIDGADIMEVNLASLRRQIGVVSQHSVLFHGTIAQNIAYGRGQAKHDDIVKASQSAYAHDFITDQPDGYDTLLGEGGSGLSGGQRQRVCIARAILRDPAILILDEATSQIDADSETKINQAIHDLRGRRTIFIIAHRLSTVVDADMIVVMDQGAIVDKGTHEQLLERCSIYQTLTKHQFVLASPPGIVPG